MSRLNNPAFTTRYERCRSSSALSIALRIGLFFVAVVDPFTEYAISPKHRHNLRRSDGSYHSCNLALDLRLLNCSWSQKHKLWFADRIVHLRKAQTSTAHLQRAARLCITDLQKEWTTQAYMQSCTHRAKWPLLHIILHSKCSPKARSP